MNHFSEEIGHKNLDAVYMHAVRRINEKTMYKASTYVHFAYRLLVMINCTSFHKERSIFSENRSIFTGEFLNTLAPSPPYV